MIFDSFYSHSLFLWVDFQQHIISLVKTNINLISKPKPTDHLMIQFLSPYNSFIFKWSVNLALTTITLLWENNLRFTYCGQSSFSLPLFWFSTWWTCSSVSWRQPLLKTVYLPTKEELRNICNTSLTMTGWPTQSLFLTKMRRTSHTWLLLLWMKKTTRMLRSLKIS